ncbi:tRNA 5-methoxyuridine(34)/uridine 5-oxyacetic acid(34) synthase CmoB [Nitratifractor salsuginis]|uniref:Methyltransferase n=1 Tax=Nitratifractor salsuginis (strain DSM 16511 / JCM 12458 / E9I37-1) TaxID=749222 RepID=E6X071_NITSE|nr:tRNA 5-methoxyuridine(34)/uridine 5-oxyacetic acid(34) synthase CmoB [Nitratifractor salsuginis]ADV45660.1 methyltransferase [Nitratifractor salsuginis DSM 16511]
MDLEALRRERRSWLRWKNIAPLQEAIQALPEPEVERVLWDAEAVTAELDPGYDARFGRQIEETARLLMPWRKGPFRLGNLFIDSEWRSQIKYGLLEPYLDLRDKVVGDIGCNNGYYLFRMMEQVPARLVGFDPSALYYSQFQFLERFFRSGIRYELLGVEHLPFYEEPFDTLFCLGVLYHRSDPIGTLKALRRGLKKGGELFLDTFMIEGEGEYCLTPAQRYSKIPNVYFIPTIDALRGWCHRAGFSEVEILAKRPTDVTEQRKTDWIATQSLEDFLDPEDPSKTVEGYPAPQRLYVRCVV